MLKLPPLDRLLDALLLLELLLRDELPKLLLRPLLELDFGGLMMLGRLLDPPLLLLALLRDEVLREALLELRLRCRLLSAPPRLPPIGRLLDALPLLLELLRDELPEGRLLNPLVKPDFGVVMLGRLLELPPLRMELLELLPPTDPCLPVGCGWIRGEGEAELEDDPRSGRIVGRGWLVAGRPEFDEEDRPLRELPLFSR